MGRFELTQTDDCLVLNRGDHMGRFDCIYLQDIHWSFDLDLHFCTRRHKIQHTII